MNSYRVNQIMGVKIPKPKGGHRQLDIPTVKDRMVQQAIRQILERRGLKFVRYADDIIILVASRKTAELLTQ